MPQFTDKCAMCQMHYEVKAYRGITRPRWLIVHYEGYPDYTEWYVICGVCQMDRWRSMNRSRDFDNDYEEEGTHEKWHQKIYDWLAGKAARAGFTIACRLSTPLEVVEVPPDDELFYCM